MNLNKSVTQLAKSRYNSTAGRIAQLVRASLLHREGQGFESLLRPLANSFLPSRRSVLAWEQLKKLFLVCNRKLTGDGQDKQWRMVQVHVDLIFMEGLPS